MCVCVCVSVCLSVCVCVWGGVRVCVLNLCVLRYRIDNMYACMALGMCGCIIECEVMQVRVYVHVRGNVPIDTRDAKCVAGGFRALQSMAVPCRALQCIARSELYTKVTLSSARRIRLSSLRPPWAIRRAAHTGGE